MRDTTTLPSSPSRKVKKAVNYAESSDEEDEEFIASLTSRKSRQRRPRAAVIDEGDEDTYEAGANEVDEEDGMLELSIPFSGSRR